MTNRKELNPTLQKQQNGRYYFIPFNTKLDVSGLNSLIKRHRRTGWKEKQDLTICYLQEMHFTVKNKYWLMVKK
jgi:hypothetical protein